VALTKTVIDLLKEAKAHGPEDVRWVFAADKGGANVSARAKKSAAYLRTTKVVSFEFHRHDLRRTAASNMGAAGIQTAVIAKVLNHVDRGARATAIYDRYSYDAEKRVALETWERRLSAILAKQDVGRVVPFAARA
jgi:integrase